MYINRVKSNRVSIKKIKNKEETIAWIKERCQPFVESNTDECLHFHDTEYGKYGHISFTLCGKSTTFSAHRVVYVLFNNYALEDNEIILHTCDNPPCCNPRHLIKGSYKDNIQDMMSKKEMQLL